jgi:hypothetical protein
LRRAAPHLLFRNIRETPGRLSDVAGKPFGMGKMSNIFEIFDKIADQRIREAIERGEFDDLPGKGKPLQLEDDRHISADMRLAYKILKNANCLPPEVELRKQIQTTEELLAGMKDTKEKYRQIKKLNYLVMKLNMTRTVPLNLEKDQKYYEKVLDKLGHSHSGEDGAAGDTA